MCGEEEETVRIILKCSETKLWSENHIKNGWERFGNEILIKTANIKKKGSLKMGEFFKYFRKKKNE
jgi:hypothetical protein